MIGGGVAVDDDVRAPRHADVDPDLVEVALAAMVAAPDQRDAASGDALAELIEFARFAFDARLQGWTRFQPPLERHLQWNLHARCSR